MNTNALDSDKRNWTWILFRDNDKDTRDALECENFDRIEDVFEHDVDESSLATVRFEPIVPAFVVNANSDSIREKQIEQREGENQLPVFISDDVKVSDGSSHTVLPRLFSLGFERARLDLSPVAAAARKRSSKSARLRRKVLWQDILGKNRASRTEALYHQGKDVSTADTEGIDAPTEMFDVASINEAGFPIIEDLEQHRAENAESTSEVHPLYAIDDDEDEKITATVAPPTTIIEDKASLVSDVACLESSVDPDESDTFIQEATIKHKKVWLFSILPIIFLVIIACSIGYLFITVSGVFANDNVEKIPTLESYEFELSDDDIDKLALEGYDAIELTETADDFLNAFCTFDADSVFNGSWESSWEKYLADDDALVDIYENLTVTLGKQRWRESFEQHPYLCSEMVSFEGATWFILPTSTVNVPYCDAYIIVDRAPLYWYGVNSPKLEINRYLDRYRIVFDENGFITSCKRIGATVLEKNIDADTEKADAAVSKRQLTDEQKKQATERRKKMEADAAEQTRKKLEEEEKKKAEAEAANANANTANESTNANANSNSNTNASSSSDSSYGSSSNTSSGSGAGQTPTDSSSGTQSSGSTSSNNAASSSGADAGASNSAG